MNRLAVSRGATHQASRPEGTLTDTGALFALVNPQGEPERYARCRAALDDPKVVRLPMVTPPPCLTEAVYLAGKNGAWPMQSRLRAMITTGQLVVAAMETGEWQRAWAVMETYQDRPADLADASLVALAESRGYERVFTLDSDFYFYELAGGRFLEVVPGPEPKTGKSR